MGKKDVTIRSTEALTEVEIAPIGMRVAYNSETAVIEFFGGKNNEIRLAGNTRFAVDGDLYIAANGELGIMTRGEGIHLDSIGGKIHLNSRQSKILKDRPESLEYLERMRRLENRVKELEGCQCQGKHG
jgi:hypothetical protein